MATFMYYPNFAGAAHCSAVIADAQYQRHQMQPRNQLQTTGAPMHTSASMVGLPHGLPPLMPYGGYYPQQAPLGPQCHEQQQQMCYGASAGYMMPPNGIHYLAPPPGLAAPIQASIIPPVPVQAQVQVNGGVSEVLDYNLEIMTSFVVQNAYLLFTNDEIMPDILEVFSKGVSSVLNATRLPSTTIFYALDYLAKYLGKLPNRADSIGGDSINVIYQNLMVAFVLANKFNDDKTFTNKSWSQATGMKVEVINTYEREWLRVFNWRLFEDGFENYEAYNEAFYSYDLEKKRQQQQQQQQKQQQNHHRPSMFVNPRMPANVSSNSFTPPPSLVCAGSNYYSSTSPSPFSHHGYRTPPRISNMDFSSPKSDVKTDLLGSSYYQATFASPLSNSSPLPKSLTTAITTLTISLIGALFLPLPRIPFGVQPTIGVINIKLAQTPIQVAIVIRRPINLIITVLKNSWYFDTSDRIFWFGG